jgi:predicted lipoprotein with Yx(FWY)xxD motif
MSLTITRPRFGLATVIAGAAIVLAACSSAATPTPPAPTAAPTQAATAAPSEAASAAPSAPASAAPSAPPSEAAASGGGGAYTIAAATGAVGKYLTGEDGKTLYVFSKDTTPGKSACNGDCAGNWPPFTLDAGETAVDGAGVSGKIATITRDDGTKQVTYNGKPVYYYAGDSASGQTNGQGVAGLWTVAAP